MRTPIDALRSIKTHFAAILPGWEVRLDDEVETLPICVVSRITPVTDVRPTRELSTYQFTARAACFPGPMPSVEEAVLAMGAVEALVIAGLRQGAGPGHNLRIPLYDYAAVGKDAAPLPAPSVDRPSAHDFLRVSAVSMNPMIDPEDQRSHTLVVSFVVQWRAVAELDTSGKTVTGVHNRFDTDVMVRPRSA